MAFQDLAPELVHHIYNILPTISDVINLSLTCHRMNAMLRNAQKLGTLFAAADREFGPIQDIKMLVTHNNAIPAHVLRHPPMSYALLRQVIVVGRVGKRFEELYPNIKWQDDFLNRRQLSSQEARRVRQAIYRYWLYSEAFHTSTNTRAHRLLSASIEDRSRLLRSWSSAALIDIEDVRSIMEGVLKHQICPTDGVLQQRFGRDGLFNGWQHTSHTYPPMATRFEHMQKIFHSVHDDLEVKMCSLTPIQARLTRMEGWGDEISQYYHVQSMLKLNPAQILWLYDHVTYKWQVEAFIRELGEEWFWNNGQTLLDTWMRVLHARGEDAEDVRRRIIDGELGIAAEEHDQDDACE